MSHERRKAWLAAGGVLAVTVLVFARVVGFEFVWDDKTLIESNPYLLQDSTPWRAFSRGFWELTTVSHESDFYRPLAIVAYWSEARLFGLRPAGFHAVSLGLHVISTLAVLGIARRLGLPLAGAVVAALVFALHPVQVTAVANVASQTDLLATAASLTACLLWTGDSWRRWLALPLLFLGLLAKESAAVAPLLAILLRHVSREEQARPVDAAPLAVLVPYAILRFSALGVGLAGGGERAWHGGMGYAHYVARLLLPFPEPPDQHVDPPGLFLAAASALVLAGAIFLLVTRVRDRVVRFAASWLLLSLLPVAELIPLGARRNDLLLYLPLVGPALLVGHLVVSRRRLVAAAVVLVGCVVLVSVRLPVWRDSLSLWADGVALDPGRPTMRMNLANALREAGQEARGCEELARALELAQAAAVLDVEVRALYNLGNCRRNAQDPAGALPFFRLAHERSRGGFPPAMTNLAVTLMDLRQPKQAVPIAAELVRFDPSLGASWHLLAVAQAQSGDLAGAEASLVEGARADRNSREIRDMLGRVRRLRGQ